MLFRYIHAMSRSRSYVVDTAKAYTDRIRDNLMKCAIYQNSTQDYNHWIERIASWLYSVSRAKGDKNKKLRESEYINLTFRFIGDDIGDAEGDLIGFLANNEDNKETGSKSYPTVAFEDEMAQRLFSAWNSVLGVIPKLLADTRVYNVKEIESLLHQLLDSIFL